MKKERYIHPTVPQEVMKRPIFPQVQPLTESSNLGEYLAGWASVYLMRNNIFFNDPEAISPQKIQEIFWEVAKEYIETAQGNFPQFNSQFTFSELVDATIQRAIQSYNQQGNQQQTIH